MVALKTQQSLFLLLILTSCFANPTGVHAADKPPFFADYSLSLCRKCDFFIDNGIIKIFATPEIITSVNLLFPRKESFNEHYEFKIPQIWNFAKLEVLELFAQSLCNVLVDVSKLPQDICDQPNLFIDKIHSIILKTVPIDNCREIFEKMLCEFAQVNSSPVIEAVKSINILDLPEDILKHIMKYCEPSELIQLGSTCKSFRSLYYQANQKFALTKPINPLDTNYSLEKFLTQFSQITSLETRNLKPTRPYRHLN